MIASLSGERKKQLGDFVRAQREKLTPEALGLPASGRRRTPGLRREEAAQLCGLSVTWYTWLEQGRDVSMSPSALARLAGALNSARRSAPICSNWRNGGIRTMATNGKRLSPPPRSPA